MKLRRSWLSLIGFCLGTVLASALAFAAVIAGGSVALAGRQSQSTEPAQGSGSENMTPAVQVSGTHFTGMVTDSHCGARHMRNSQQNASQCARACFRRGATYVLVDGDHRYTLIGSDGDLGKLAGERATIIGIRQGDAILVDSASPIF